MNKGLFYSLILASFLVTACATKPTLLPNEKAQIPDNANKAKAVTDISHMTPEQRSQLYYSILLARLAEKQRFYDIAQSNYQDALDKTNSPELAGQSTRIALYQHDYDTAEQALNIWQKNLPESSSPKKVALLIAIHKDQFEKAYQQLLSLYPLKGNSKNSNKITLSNTEQEQQFKELLQIAYSKTLDDKNLEQQVISLTELLTKYNDENPQTAYANITQTAEAFFKLKSRNPLTKLTRIHQLLDKTIERSPNFMAAIDTKAQALSLLSEAKSSEFLQKILKHQSLSKPQIMRLANLAYRQKDYPSAEIGFKRILEAEPDNSETQFLLAGSYFAQKEFEKSSELFYQLATDDYRKAASAFYCGDSAQRMDDTIKSLSCFEMVPVSQYFLEARQRMADIFAKQKLYREGAESLEKAQSLVDFNQRQMLLKYEVNYLLEYEQYDLARKRLESAIQLEPHNGTIYYLQLLLADKTLNQQDFLGKVNQLRNQAPDLALEKEVIFSAMNILTSKQAHKVIFALLDDAVKANPEDLDLLYTRALSNEPLNRYDRLEADLRYLLSIKPDHVNAQNALGYTLADLNKNLSEAKRLIESAYQEDPNNDAIMDSMGWVQYRLGNLPEALRYIQMSYDKAPAPEIAAHLGEVLWQMGQTEKAIQIWSEGLKSDPNNRYIRDTLSRFPEADLQP